MVDNSSIIEGTVKFRDGKKWKSRWCVMRKLSPVADCLHLQMYRDSKDRYKQGQTKASLSLEHFLGLEIGFTLDKESNTVAILCQDVVVVLAFDNRERLMQWQVKLTNHLGDGSHYLVLLSSGPSKARLQPGPARLHIQEFGFCLSTGLPPRVAGHWYISHLRRYGVVEGRFCFEGGSRCGSGEGLYILLTDQGEEITATLKLASEGQLFTTRRRSVMRNNTSVMDSPRRSVTRAESRKQELIDSSHSRADSPYTDLESNYGGCGEMNSESWSVPPIERCLSCISKLGALSRSSTVATTPGAPCWEHSCDRHSLSSGSDCSGWSQTVTKPPARPPKPQILSPQKKAISPPPPSYDNYDIPRIPLPITNTAVDTKADDYYDTPKKIKECLGEAVRKPCGCVLRVRQTDQERPCVCQRLLSCWSNQDDVQALYATVDLSKKCNRNHNYANFQPQPNSNYVNMEFAQSLELYENAKQVAQNAGLCNKCGHIQSDYLMMEPASKKAQSTTSYLPMSPAIKQRLDKMISSSNPNLAPAIDRGGKPSGSAMLQANVYQRKQILDSTDNLEQRRRRSNSADSSRCEDSETTVCNCTQSVVRRSSSVPCKSNRDSSSSNDSGVFELPRRITHCVTTLPRRSKSSDPLGDLSFQFQKTNNGKSASAEAEVPVCPSESTSSATSDMSDYIETLSLSSHSSNEAPPPSCTLRPRSGNEYWTLQRLIAPVPEELHN